MENLTEKDKQLLEIVETHYAASGFPLSLAECAEAMGMSKGSVIADMVKRLEAANVIEYAANRKYFRPVRWLELVAGAMPDPNATPEFEALQAEAEALHGEVKALRSEVEALRDKLAAAKPKGKAATNADLERIRLANRERQRRHKEKKRQEKKAAKKV